MCLGYWASNPPPEFNNAGFNWVNQDESIRALGMMVGNESSPSKSWDKPISKVRSFASSHNIGSLTLMGRINLANASTLGALIYHIIHQCVSPDQRNMASSVMNQFTNGNKVRSQCSYNDKIKPHEDGGPPVALLDVNAMTEGLSSKALSLDVIANSCSTSKSKPWIPLMIELLYRLRKRALKPNVPIILYLKIGEGLFPHFFSVGRIMMCSNTSKQDWHANKKTTSF